MFGCFNIETSRARRFFFSEQDSKIICNYKYIYNLVFSVRTVSYGSSFFPLFYGLRATRLGQSNLWYGPRTQLIRGIYQTNNSHHNLWL
jgi:hypothetical protein